jgi:hypothetical protein
VCTAATSSRDSRARIEGNAGARPGFSHPVRPFACCVSPEGAVAVAAAAAEGAVCVGRVTAVEGADLGAAAAAALVEPGGRPGPFFVGGSVEGEASRPLGGSAAARSGEEREAKGNFKSQL